MLAVPDPAPAAPGPHDPAEAHGHRHDHPAAGHHHAGHAHGAHAPGRHGHAHAEPARGAVPKRSFIALSGAQRLLMVTPLVALLWGLAFWAMQNG